MVKTSIKLRKEDAEILKRTLKLADPQTISKRIGESLEQLAAAREAELADLEEIELKIGIFPGTLSRERVKSDNFKLVKFYGRRLAKHTRSTSPSKSSEEGIDYTLYQTKKGKFLLHVYDWSRWKNKNSHSRYQIYEHLDDIEEAPDPLIAEAKEKLGEDPAVYLDI